jgi:CheY-like chemotaxis protein
MPLEQLSPHRILVVDDNEPHARELAAQLKKAGHVVEIAYDGQSALDLERAFQPEMVIVELALAGTGAFPVARSLRTQRGSELMLVSVAFGDFEDHDRAVWEACFDDHVNKLHGVPILMRGRKKLADISPEDWVLDQRLLSREDFTLELLSSVTARPLRPQFDPVELAPLIPDEVLGEIRRLAESPAALANYAGGEATGRIPTEDQANILEGASRWFRFFHP